ncbi:MAG: hypothetical protein K0R59_4330 [Sphingobacterium sp.]|jgi:hypothetical protein|nr:hypothetical protein [Sphingobacterium sp.]
MEKLIEDVLIDVLQLLGVGVLSLISYFIYHSATLKKLEKYVLAIEKQTPVLDKIVGKIKDDAQALLDNEETKAAIEASVAKLLQQKGLPVTQENVAKVIDTLEDNAKQGAETVKKA